MKAVKYSKITGNLTLIAATNPDKVQVSSPIIMHLNLSYFDSIVPSNILVLTMGQDPFTILCNIVPTDLYDDLFNYLNVNFIIIINAFQWQVAMLSDEYYLLLFQLSFNETSPSSQC